MTHLRGFLRCADVAFPTNTSRLLMLVLVAACACDSPTVGGMSMKVLPLRLSHILFWHMRWCPCPCVLIPTDLVPHENSFRYLACACSDRLMFTIKLYDTQSWLLIDTLAGHHDLIYDLCWNAEDTEIVSSSSDATAKVREIFVMSLYYFRWWVLSTLILEGLRFANLCLRLEQQGSQLCFCALGSAHFTIICLLATTDSFWIGLVYC